MDKVINRMVFNNTINSHIKILQHKSNINNNNINLSLALPQIHR